MFQNSLKIEILFHLWDFVNHRSFIFLSWMQIVRFPLEIERCTVVKVPRPKREGSPVLLLQNYPHPLSLRDRSPYHLPTPLNTWAPRTWPPSPLLLFPLKKKKQNWNKFKVWNVIQLFKIKIREKYLLTFS